MLFFFIESMVLFSVGVSRNWFEVELFFLMKVDPIRARQVKWRFKTV